MGTKAEIKPAVIERGGHFMSCDDRSSMLQSA